jgi:hypothetical protein
MFNLRMLNDVEVIEMYQVKISYRFVALEDLCGDVDISRTWESIGQNIKTSVTESLGYNELTHYTIR